MWIGARARMRVRVRDRVRGDLPSAPLAVWLVGREETVEAAGGEAKVSG